MQSHNVIADLKHYTAYNQETNRTGQNAIMTERTLREVYALASRWSSGQRLGAVMCSFNKINGDSCQNALTLRTC